MFRRQTDPARQASANHFLTRLNIRDRRALETASQELIRLDIETRLQTKPLCSPFTLSTIVSAQT
jgi:hypothetical protein